MASKGYVSTQTHEVFSAQPGKGEKNNVRVSRKAGLTLRT